MAHHFHPFHIVLPSPWPFAARLGATALLTRAVRRFKGRGATSAGWRLLLLAVISALWWRDVRREGRLYGNHTRWVKDGIKLGISLFILREVLFFTAWFWGYFHHRTVPILEEGLRWPPVGVEGLNPLTVPLLNTLILLSSGVTVTWAHYILLINGHPWWGVIRTVILGGIFTAIQGLEYYESPFTISDGAFGRLFFVTTGFHGTHVIVGVIFLISAWLRQRLFLAQHTSHLGVELAIWYWHFVDVVWLFLFTFYYIWGI